MAKFQPCHCGSNAILCVFFCYVGYNDLNCLEDLVCNNACIVISSEYHCSH